MASTGTSARKQMPTCCRLDADRLVGLAAEPPRQVRVDQPDPVGGRCDRHGILPGSGRGWSRRCVPREVGLLGERVLLIAAMAAGPHLGETSRRGCGQEGDLPERVLGGGWSPVWSG
jgi:hypothetical protein